MKLNVDPGDQEPSAPVSQANKLTVGPATSVPAASASQTAAQTIDYSKTDSLSFKVLFTGTLTQNTCPKVLVGTTEVACSSVSELTGTYTLTKDQIKASTTAYDVKTVNGCGVETTTGIKLTITEGGSTPTSSAIMMTFSKITIVLMGLLLL